MCWRVCQCPPHRLPPRIVSHGGETCAVVCPRPGLLVHILATILSRVSRPSQRVMQTTNSARAPHYPFPCILCPFRSAAHHLESRHSTDTPACANLWYGVIPQHTSSFPRPARCSCPCIAGLLPSRPVSAATVLNAYPSTRKMHGPGSMVRSPGESPDGLYVRISHDHTALSASGPAAELAPEDCQRHPSRHLQKKSEGGLTEPHDAHHR
jgi:hypothetical protein